MPLREYRCKACGHRFEVLERSTAGASAEKVACEVCASKRVERMLSVFAPAVGGGAADAGPRCDDCSCERRGNCPWES